MTIAPEELITAATAADRDARWETAPLGTVIDHVLARFHAPLREQLRELIDLATTVERVHAGKAACPTGLADHLRNMAEVVEEHLQKEEQILFPLIRAGRGTLAQMPIRVMQHEHTDHLANLERMREVAHGLVPPSDGCASWAALYRGLRDLAADLEQHIALENEILFPRALRG